MLRKLRTRLVTSVALVCVFMYAQARAAVNLEWRPLQQTVALNDTVNIGLYAVSSSSQNQSVGAISVILSWNPDKLELMGHLDNGPYAWELSSFPNDSGLDGLNEPFVGAEPFTPANDGMVLYSAFRALKGQPAFATPQGLLVTTFQFRAEDTGTTIVEMVASFGQFSETRVLHGTFPGIEVTGTLSPPSVVVVGQPSVLYVDGEATGRNDGTSWVDAFTSLQTAIDVAGASATTGEIWVAKTSGGYRPAAASGSRSTSFELANGVAVYGGFAGTETLRSQRNPRTNTTILTGDLNGNDDATALSRDDNSYHVVDGSGVDNTAILDGFTIVGGNANGTNSNQQRGGGVYVSQGSPTIRRCTFVSNRASHGAGAFAIGGSPTFLNCLFFGNVAGGNGGAIAGDAGSTVLIANGVFSGNSANAGGAIHAAFGSHVTLVNASLSGNHATTIGGGVRNASSSQTSITNSILWGNSDNSGNGATSQIDVAGGTVTVNETLIQGGWTGPGGEDIQTADPQFVDADGEDGVVGTIDDNLHLPVASPCIDEGSNTALPPDSSDIDHDGDIVELLPIDADGHNRFTGGAKSGGAGDNATVDLGAYELGADCNANGIPDDVETGDGSAPDCDGNAVPDSCDIAGGGGTDCDNNGVMDACEIATGERDDCNEDQIPDDCTTGPNGRDCNDNDIFDVCEITDGSVADCNGNEIPDSCEIADGSAADCNTNGIPDACDGGCGTNGGGGGGGPGGGGPIGGGNGNGNEEPQTPCAELDDDNDTVNNCNDQCASTPRFATVDSDGCSCRQRDTDADLINDCDDDCPSTVAGGAVDANGCSCQQRDTDDDSMNDCDDNCPARANANQADADDDGVGDACDNCPATANANQADADGNGTGDACEEQGPGSGFRTCAQLDVVRVDSEGETAESGQSLQFNAFARMRDAEKPDDDVLEPVTETATWSSSCGGSIEDGIYITPSMTADTECTVMAVISSDEGSECVGSMKITVEAQQQTRRDPACGSFGNCAPTGPSMIMTMLALFGMRVVRRRY